VIITRPIRLPADATAVDALDHSSMTTTAYEIRRGPGADGVAMSVDLVGP